jgi:hypothetical protein
VEGAGAKAARITLRRVGAFSESLPIPTDASGTYRPAPQATTELDLGPPSLKGYLAYPLFLAFQFYAVYNQLDFRENPKAFTTEDTETTEPQRKNLQ